MARKNPYIVAGKIFNTKQELREYIRKIRDSYSIEQNLNSSDYEFMRALLDRHQDAEQKIGCGVTAIRVQQESHFGTRHFELIRVDGSITDFSFEICLRHETKLQQFKGACRTAVAEIVIKFRQDYFARMGGQSKCPFTGEVITLSNSHVDHAPPNTFDKIVADFIEQYKIDVDNIELIGPAQDGIIRNEIVDDSIRTRFIDFHNERASLRVVSKRANLSQIKVGAEIAYPYQEEQPKQLTLF